MAMFNSFLYVYQRVHTFTIWLWHSQFAMENPQNKWRFLAGNIIYKWAIYTMAMYAFPALFLRPADCGTLRDHLMTADVPSFVSACSHSCPACCFTHIYNHIWYIYIQLNKCYIYIYYISLSYYKYLPYWVLFASASHHWGTQNCMVDTNEDQGWIKDLCSLSLKSMGR